MRDKLSVLQMTSCIGRRSVGFVLDRIAVFYATGALIWAVQTFTGRDYPMHRLWGPLSLQPGYSALYDLGLGFALGLPVLEIFLLLAVYSVAAIHFYGGTPGMLAAGVMIQTTEGGRPSFAQVLARHLLSYLSAVILGLGYAWSVLDPQCRTLHDVLSHTKICYRDGRSPST